jgi:hypothetical protein
MKKLVLLLCIAFAPLAHAQDDRGMYFGAGLGSFDYDEGDIDGGISDSSYAYQLFGGYKFLDNFALEFGLTGTGDFEETFTESLPGLGELTVNVDVNIDVYRLMAIGILPFDRFSLFAGAGYYSAGFGGDVNVAGFGDAGSFDGGHENGAAATFGIQRDFGLDLKSLSIRGQYDWYDFPDGIDASAISVAVLFRF